MAVFHEILQTHVIIITGATHVIIITGVRVIADKNVLNKDSNLGGLLK